MHSRRVSIAALLIQAMAGSVVLADFNFPDFNSTAGLNLVGVTERVGNRLRLSPNKPEEVGAAWFTTKQQVAGGFETTFQFQITNQGGTAIELGADGFVFVIQSAGTAELGDFGGAIGYNGFPSVAVEFDTFPNPENNDPNNNHISVHTLNGLPNTQNHSASIGQTTSIADLSDGSTHVVKIVYVPGTLEVFLNNLTTPVLTVSVNIATALSLPGNDAYVGFTSATGLSFETHDILSWSFDGCADSDADQICDDEDNCPDDPNPTQTDSDSDSFGDACDNCPGFNDLIDNDGDSAPDGCDNCPTIPNPNQADGDNDNIGDCCDPDLGDDDADGVSDPCDNCPDDSNVDQADADFDGIGDVCDPCFDPPTQDDRTWIAGSGNWSNSAAWSPAGVPDSLAEAAFVPSGGGALTIGLDISPTIQTLMIGNADATLNLGGRALTVARCDGVDNSGTIIANPGAGNAIHGYIFNRPGGLIAVSDVQSLLLTGPEIVNDATITLGTGANAASTLTFGADVSLSGTGDILMPNSASTLATTDPFALTQEVGHLIHGRGAVSGVVTNKGTIRADISGQILFLNTNDKTNEGTLEAMLGSRMEIDAVTIDNAGGTIVGNEGEVDIDPGSLILEGSLDSVGAGLVLGRGGSVQDVTNLGLFRVADNNAVTVLGSTLTNNATIELGSGLNATARLSFASDVTVAGPGDIHMRDSGSTLETTDAFVVTNAADHLIHGRGVITGMLLNLGTVRADISGQILFLNTNDKTNEGTLEAMLGSRMEIDAVTINNAGGTIVGNEGEVDIDPGSLILEGSLDSVGAGLVLGRGGSVQDVTNLGLFRVADNNAVTVLGSTLTNNATIELGSGLNATARLSFASDVTVAGPGDIHMRDSGSTLETTDAFVVTNAADHLIHGRGVITGTLLNLGTVRADINSQVLFLRDNPKTNNGMIEALSDSQVEIETVTIANSGGTLLGDEGVVNLELGATIVGGTLDTVGAGLILGESNSVLQDVTNAGLFRVASVNSVSVTGTSLMNDGTIELGTGVGATSTLRFEADISVAGSGDILMRDSAATIATTDAFVVTNEADQLIHGRGQITGTLVNHGTIRADLNGQTLFFRTNPKTNDGLIEALGGSQVEIEVVTVNNAGGTLLANEGIVNLELGATVVGGTLDSVGDGFILGESNSVLEDVTNLGRYIVGSLNTNQVDGSTLTNNGTIFIGNNVGATTTLSFIADVSVGGSGEIVMQDSAATLMTDTGIQSTHAAGHTIRGRGVINADLVNKGTIICDRNPMFINPAGAGVDNQGTMRVINPGLMTINTATLFTNNGAVTVDSGRTLTVNGGNYTQTAGVTTVEGSLNVTGGQVALQGGVLRGNGTVSGGVTNTGGTTAPGSSAGKLTVTGNYTQSNNGVLKIEIGGLNATTEHDVLAVSGTATLGGELNVVPTGGFIPQIGQQFVILTANSVQQTFSTVTGPGTYTVQYNPGNVVLTVATVPCNGFAPADFDQDCDVDQDDIALFEACASGPAMPLMLGCEDKDFDSDNDTDQSDFGVMQRCLSGPNTPADLNCAD